MCTNSLCQSHSSEFTIITNDATEVMTVKESEASSVFRRYLKQISRYLVVHQEQHSRNTTISDWVGGESQMRGTSCLASDG